MATLNLDHHYLDGQWQPCTGPSRFPIINPTSEALIGHVRSGSKADVDAAVGAARRAFGDWSETPPETRAEYLDALFRELDVRADEIATSITAEVGSTLSLSRPVQAGAAISKFRDNAAIALDYPFEEYIGPTPILKEPVGVVACITPWNFPLLQIAAKVAPALAAGCTVILKPSELAPTNAKILAECVHAANLPAGVFNLVWGDGPNIGQHLVAHADVDMVSFTGSTAAGRTIAGVAGQTIKRVTMELGGKSAAIVFEDADLERAVSGVLETCFVNSGQSCTAHSRLVVPESLEAQAVEVARSLAEQWTLGDPMDDATRMGPVISNDQRTRVRALIEQAEAEGAHVVTGGAAAPAGHSSGFFVAPTVLSNVRPDDTIAQTEVFGPVLSVLTARDDDDAVRIANHTIYGLSGGVWSADRDRALGIARRLRTGTVEVNGGTFNGAAPFGGYRQSGLGREMGLYGFEEFLELKTLQV
ncbi:MAG: aldehyde dehydrogenase family protein [Pseudomonadota bacterium]